MSIKPFLPAARGPEAPTLRLLLLLLLPLPTPACSCCGGGSAGCTAAVCCCCCCCCSACKICIRRDAGAAVSQASACVGLAGLGMNKEQPSIQHCSSIARATTQHTCGIAQVTVNGRKCCLTMLTHVVQGCAAAGAVCWTDCRTPRRPEEADKCLIAI